ncbi:Hypothetical protein SRAE_2000308700 [Strongyloides ratti]|uniref:Uncharacterized protein n=1 Tax=Strongyloides ratti TaxID=34506 RepID=A0A090LLK4_STRRB|nr:Hypothetical protein SRAE_2000308700 [Strongyloides ratti]CEF68430.1 Hypothetical protein SRAE_2000308700 [Strongyloides ratti]
MLSRIRITKSLLSTRLITFQRSFSVNVDEVLLKENEIKGIPFIKKITTELEKQKDIKYILPFHDDELMKKITTSFDYFTNVGIQPEFLLDACLNDPLFMKAMVKQGDKIIKIINLLVETTNMTFENAIRLFTIYKDDLLATSIENIQSHIQVFTSGGISEPSDLCNIICKCPVLLFSGDSKEMLKLVGSLSNFFTKNQIKCILRNSPQCVLMNFEQIEEKYEYIYFLMGIEGDEFKMCKKWIDMPLDEIIKRHEFLLKCGRYVTPDPKRLQLQKENPPLYRIIDTDSVIFATQVASVTYEEWVIYEGLHEKLKEMEQKERPFERVKPSVRKAYERKVKKPEPNEDFILESQ